MTDILINCDMGERGVRNETDLAIMACLGVANIACGGHAGDPASVCFFTDLARQHGVIASAHLSYPDRANFGRITMDIGAAALCDSLTAQFRLAPGITWLKFHGALYNDSCRREPLAATLAGWASQSGITHVVTQGDSALAEAARARGLEVVAEVYAERRYTLDDRQRLCLVPRNKPYAGIHRVDEALAQARRIIRERSVQAVVGERPDGSPVTEPRPLHGRTICVHSDSAIALPLVKGLSALIRETRES